MQSKTKSLKKGLKEMWKDLKNDLMVDLPSVLFWAAIGLGFIYCLVG